MNKERIQLLVDALRSGQYVQGRDHLSNIVTDEITRKTRQEDCCLGVACKVAISHGVEIRVEEKVHADIYGEADGIVLYDDADIYMPKSVFDWYEIEPPGDFGPYFNFDSFGNFYFEVGDGQDSVNAVGALLIGWIGADQLNDAGYTFSQIADMIEHFYL